MNTRLSHGASGALRRFAGRVARHLPLLDGIEYWDELRDSPTQPETVFAIFANVLELDDQGEPVNEKYAQRRAAVWLRQYRTGRTPEGEPPLAGWDVELYQPARTASTSACAGPARLSRSSKKVRAAATPFQSPGSTFTGKPGSA